ncbi:SpoIIE family protein phosphatase [Nonomuraea sp. B19D2]|uniref:SpoIIE family protein phosphatase n=1 Tax=Nonomuraea sp. B19D2 TaxID=3159561 RepID=UPI0032DAFD8D
MTFLAISILVGCLSVMTARQGNRPSGLPVARPRLVAAGGTYAGSRGRASDAYVVQERLVAAAHGAGGDPLLRGLGLPSALNPEVGAVPLRPGDRVVIVSDGAIRVLGAARMKELFTDGASPGACLDRLYDEMAAAEPKDDATVIIADYVTA